VSADASKRNMKGGNLEKNSREFLEELKLVHLSIVQTIQE